MYYTHTHTYYIYIYILCVVMVIENYNLFYRYFLIDIFKITTKSYYTRNTIFYTLKTTIIVYFSILNVQLYEYNISNNYLKNKKL